MSKKIDFDKVYIQGNLFLKLYEKYLMEIRLEKIKKAMEELPTNILERVLTAKQFHEKTCPSYMEINRTSFGFNGLCGYKIIEEIERELIAYQESYEKGLLEKTTKHLGQKVDERYVGFTGELKIKRSSQ